MVVGIDEVGRGPWAGPLVFGAVVLGDVQIEGLTDSKKMTKKRREILAAIIHEKAKGVGLGWVEARELDDIGMSEALRVGCRRALAQITVPYQQIILDGTINFLEGTGKGPYVTTLAKADMLVPSVSAASIVAKVARDAFMSEQDAVFPGYGFGSHMGYGTKLHREAINQLGVTPLHRLSFAPLAQYRCISERETSKTVVSTPATRDIGNEGESSACRYLEAHGYRIIERNWRTKLCEIDIIATKRHITYFVEVKYRKRIDQGGGLAAITPRKLKQMKFAAQIWLQNHEATAAQLSVIEVSGDEYEVTAFLENV